ncbi:MAG: hypothetical protein GQ527_01740 [Bacteroidales bacterium]|nr:hypothetical protein [Bacteroidales bacterium]
MEFTTEKLNFKGNRVLSHILFWILYIVFFILQVGLFSENANYSNIGISMFSSSIVDILAAYFTVYYLLPQFLFKKKYLSFGFVFILSAGIAIIIQRVILHEFIYPYLYPDSASANSPFWRINPFYSLINIYTVVAFFASIKLIKYWYQNQQYKLELENKNKTSELALLRTQLNPHCLFNTLNNIDSLILTNQDKASDAIIKLSDILRFMIYDTKDSISMEKEIEYLKNYISLQQLRIKDPHFVDFKIEGDFSGKSIAPMLLIPFVENAFKHGLKKVESPGIIIHLTCDTDTIIFEVSNKYNDRIEFSKDKTAGIGLANTKRRLELLYPDMYDFSIKKQDDIYLAHLEIKFKKQ